jgi:hypothetical protein
MKHIQIVIDLEGEDQVLDRIRDFVKARPHRIHLQELIDRWKYNNNDLTAALVVKKEVTEDYKMRSLKVVEPKKESDSNE